jgi:murein DD-endopeptidase MepM/ murein hydrolase activator NlpD
MRSRAGFALALGVLLLATCSAAAAVRVRIVPPAPRQGAVAVVFLAGAQGARQVEGSLGGRSLAFFPYGEGYAAIAGIDLEARPGKTPWRVGVVDSGGEGRQLRGSVTITTRKFPVQRLTLPTHMVDLDPETTRRAESESARLKTLYETATPERLWRGSFTRPVGGEGKGEGFCSRRIINGQPRLPHSGLDFSAERGVPVVAANRGRVALVADFFFPGRLVALDHGLGLYTLYMHLDRVDVSEGTLVERGTPIGAVGASGRATGPHLHFAAQVRQARVDPAALFGVPLRD